MDEPLSNLDAKLRVSTRTQIAALQRRLGVTTVYVTHDQIEAMTMGDRVCVLSDGLLQQVDSPLNLYSRPANSFVAGFIGSPAMNLREFRVIDGHARVGTMDIPLSREEISALGREGLDRVLLGFRPESVEIVREGEGFPVVVHVVEELGSDAFLHGTLLEEDPLSATEIVARVDPKRIPESGSTVHLRLLEGEEHVFSPTTGTRLL
jgi:multiple sugar transport system ATP-binding protein